MTYYCNEDEEFIVSIHSVDRDEEGIARILGKAVEMDLFPCDSDKYSDFEESTFSHDTVVIEWSQLEAYSDILSSLASKKINVYVVF